MKSKVFGKHKVANPTETRYTNQERDHKQLPTAAVWKGLSPQSL